MRIINETNYDTLKLKNLMYPLFKEMGVEHRRYSISFFYTRKNFRGRAGIGYPKMWFHVPKGKFSLEIFEHLFRHELNHTLGNLHEREGLMARHYSSELVASAREFFSEEPVAAISPIDKHKQRYDNAVKKLAQARTRVKRASTILKKWERRVKIYSKKVRA